MFHPAAGLGIDTSGDTMTWLQSCDVRERITIQLTNISAAYAPVVS